YRTVLRRCTRPLDGAKCYTRSRRAQGSLYKGQGASSRKRLKHAVRVPQQPGNAGHECRFRRILLLRLSPCQRRSKIEDFWRPKIEHVFEVTNLRTSEPPFAVS